MTRNSNAYHRRVLDFMSAVLDAQDALMALGERDTDGFIEGKHKSYYARLAEITAAADESLRDLELKLQQLKTLADHAGVPRNA